jgi:aryl-alcohol dehydrogenase-like predicted oxidoreductase
MKKRTLGRTGRELSIVGFGGIIVMDETPEDAARYVKAAVERGVNYFDVAPTYGNAEERLGGALEPYRDDVFLACKTIERSREGAAEDLAGSLKRLRTDHLDLYQFHGVTTAEDVDEITGPGGALEAVRDARARGVVRNIGFSAHSEQAALALMDRFDFDSVLYPVNYVCWNEGGFGPTLYREATACGMGVLALKALAHTGWVEGEARAWSKTWYRPVLDRGEAETALRWTLSRPVTAAVSPGHFELFEWMCDVADAFEPMTPEEEAAAAEKARGIEPIFRAPADLA